MSKAANQRLLVPGAAGKTGSRVAGKPTERAAVSVRTAARTGAEVHFDWDDPATTGLVLQEAPGVYCVSPVMRAGFAGLVSRFRDQAERARIRHVSCLSLLAESIASGPGSQPSGGVLAATGTEPISFAEFTAQTALAWKEAALS